MPALVGLIFIVVFLGISLFTQNKQTAVVPSRLLEVFNHDVPASQSLELPKIAADSAVVFDTQSGFRVLDINADYQQPIASLTKLMSALVFLDHNPGWETDIRVIKEDVRGGAKANIFPGDRIVIKDLFRAALIASDNSATIVLARSTGLSEEAFVKAMNDKTDILRIRGITFTDPTGLDIGNRGSALAVAKLAEKAFERKEITDALELSSYNFKVSATVSREVKSTNQLLGRTMPKGSYLLGGKTGHLDEAGYCFAGIFEYNGRRFVTAILGAPEDEKRFSETLKILDWTMKAYLWEN